MNQALKALHIISGLFALLILFTGGAVLNLSHATIELNRIEVFVAVSALAGALLARKGVPLTFAENVLKLFSRPWLALSLFIFFGVTLWVAHLLRHWGLYTNAYDTTFVHQALKFWNEKPLLHCDLCIGGSYFGEHATFSFLALGPLVRLLRSDEWIFSFQFLCLFLPALILITHGPIKNLKSYWFIPIIALISFRAFRNSMVWDFREDHLAFLFLTFSLLALYNHRLIAYFLCMVGALLSKENIGIVVFLSSFAIAWSSLLPYVPAQRKKIALATALISLAYLVLAWGYLMPQFNSAAPQASNLVQRFPGMGATDKEVITHLLTSPAAWWKMASWILFQSSSFKYILLCLLPFIYFFRHAPLFLIPVSGGMLMNLVSNALTQRSLQFHYELVFLPFLLFGFLLGLKKQSENQNQTVAVFLLPVTLALVGFGKSPLWEVRSYWPQRPNLETSFFLRAFRTRTTVAADDISLAQLTHIPQLRRLILPDSLSENESVLGAALKNSEKDRTGLENHSIKDARVWVFNKTHPLSERLSKELGGAGWTKLSDTSLPLAEIWMKPD